MLAPLYTVQCCIELIMQLHAAPLSTCTSYSRALQTVCAQAMLMQSEDGLATWSFAACRWASMPASTSCASFVSAYGSGLNLTLFQALNPNINCTVALPFGSLANNVSVCVDGRVLGPLDDYSNIANPARTTLLGQIVDALAPIDPLLPQLFR